MKKVRRPTDRERLRWMQKICAEEPSEGIFPDDWDSEVVRVVIDAAMRAERRGKRG